MMAERTIHLSSFFMLFIFFILLFFLSSTNARIYSSHLNEKQLRQLPTLMLLNKEGSNLMNANIPMMRFRRFILLRQRRASSANSSNNDWDKLKTNYFDLANDTTSHNQALIHWSGKNSSVIFVLTRRKSLHGGKTDHSTLWRSLNYGANYVREDGKFDKVTVLSSYFVCPTNKLKVVFIDANQTLTYRSRLWISTDEGESYKSVELNFAIDKIEFHPKQEDWLLGYDKDAAVLHVSMDLGVHWTEVQKEVTKDRYMWYVKEIDNFPEAEKIIHFEYRNMDVFPERIYQVKSCYIPECTPTPFDKEYKKLGYVDADSLVVQNNFVFVQKPGAREKFYVSYNRSNFVKAQFLSSNDQTDFHVVSSDGGSVVLGVGHSNHRTHLYFSDERGRNFVLSLSNVRGFSRRTADSEVFNIDIHEVKSVKGVFIANKGTIMRNQNITMMTWDNGRTWKPLSPPLKNRNGNPIPHCTGCALHLHCAMQQTSTTYFMPAMLSKESVPGLIVAHGNVGAHLDDKPSSVNVYVSSDAGKTWVESLSMRHMFMIADHGAIIVGVKMIFLHTVQTISYSGNYGRSWSEHKFSDIDIHVDGLLTEPGEYTHHFTLFGHHDYRGSWKLFDLDFSSLTSRNCDYPEDFRNWTMPPHPDNGQCHLGMIRTVERLEAEDGCLIGKAYKIKTSTRSCNCTPQDYECGYGYVEKVGSGCKKARPSIDFIESVVSDEDPHPTSAPCINGVGRIKKPNRRIPGDRCVNEMTSMLYSVINCSGQFTPPPEPTVHLRLLNQSSEAKIGEGLAIQVSGSNEIQVVVISGSERKDVNLPRNNSQDDRLFSLNPAKPGDYQVKAFVKTSPQYSDFMIVSFWYPIEDVVLLHPPVVEVNRAYNVTAVVETLHGRAGTSTLVGRVNYLWFENNNQRQLMDKNVLSLRATSVGAHRLEVTASNKVSWKRAKADVQVKMYVETMVLPLMTSPALNLSELTHDWLKDVRELLADKMFNIQSMLSILTSNSLVNDRNFHIFIEPSLPLQAKLFFSPTSSGAPSRENLLKAARNMMNLFSGEIIVFKLGRNNQGESVSITTGEPYVVDDNGAILRVSHGINAAVAVCIAIICIIVLIALLLIVRKFSRNARWKAYFTLRRPGGVLQPSHIVRSRPNDCEPIVDEEEFIDDELDNMETIASPQSGTLQFQG